MELEGTIQNGVAVPDGECSLPEGTRVRITVEESSDVDPKKMPFDAGQRYPIWSPTEAHAAAAALTAMLEADTVKL